MTVADLVFDGRLPLSVSDPIPAFVLVVPVMIEDERCAHFGEFGALAVAIAGAMGAGHCV